MATDRSNDPKIVLDRILLERLAPYDVPTEIRTALRKEIMSFTQRPERNPFGACVMTPEASIAADRARGVFTDKDAEIKPVDPEDERPTIV